MEDNVQENQEEMDIVHELPTETKFEMTADLDFIPIKEEAAEEKAEEIIEDRAEEKTEEKVEEDKPVEEKKDDVPVEKETPAEVKAEEDKKEFFETITPKSFMEKMDQVSMERYGLNYQDAMSFKNDNLDEISDNEESEILRMFWRSEDPGITEEEEDAKLADFDVLFIENEDERKEFMEQERLTERDVIKLNAQYSKLKRDALGALKKLQDGIQFDDVEFNIGQSEKVTKQEPQLSVEEQNNAIKEVLSAKLKEFKNDEVSIKNNEGKEIAKITINSDDSAKNKVLGANMIGRYLNEDGTPNMDKYMLDMHRLENFEKYMKESYQAGIDQGKKKEVMDVHNVDMDKRVTPSAKDQANPNAAADWALGNVM